jgi:hypothetical protein
LNPVVAACGVNRSPNSFVKIGRLGPIGTEVLPRVAPPPDALAAGAKPRSRSGPAARTRSSSVTVRFRDGTASLRGIRQREHIPWSRPHVAQRCITSRCRAGSRGARCEPEDSAGRLVDAPGANPSRARWPSRNRACSSSRRRKARSSRLSCQRCRVIRPHSISSRSTTRAISSRRARRTLRTRSASVSTMPGLRMRTRNSTSRISSRTLKPTRRRQITPVQRSRLSESRLARAAPSADAAVHGCCEQSNVGVSAGLQNPAATSMSGLANAAARYLPTTTAATPTTAPYQYGVTTPNLGANATGGNSVPLGGQYTPQTF